MISPKIISTIRNQAPSIWVTINEIVAKEKPINLGQGFPNYKSNFHIIDSLKNVSMEENPSFHQYTRSAGHMRLVNSLVQLYSNTFNRLLNAENEIIVSIGAYGSLFYSINSLIDNGDEAIIIEPYFDSYKPMVEIAGGIAKCIPYTLSANWNVNDKSLIYSASLILDERELRDMITAKTKIIIINTPNNPNGKVMNLKELEVIASICREHDLICISDEVYEWLVYQPHKHIKIATLPGMWERTITIGSLGKTLNVTGWKLGWSIGPSHLIKALHLVAQNSVYTCPTPLQEAAARALEKEIELLGTPDSYFSKICLELVDKRNRMVHELIELGMKPIVPDGGYFILADFSDLISEDFRAEAKSKNKALDVLFNEWLIKNLKVSAIPNSVFYSKEHESIGENLIRFCFFKSEETLEAAFTAFRDWKSKNKFMKV